MVNFSGARFIIAATVGVGADNQKVLGPRQFAVPDTGRMYNHIPSANFEGASARTTEANPRTSFRNTKYLMGPGVKMIVRIDAIAP
jgi:hypothetical protein